MRCGSSHYIILARAKDLNDLVLPGPQSVTPPVLCRLSQQKMQGRSRGR